MTKSNTPATVNRLALGNRPAYTADMGKHFRWRGVFALAVAYVLALQALVLPLSLGQGVPLLNNLCSAGLADTSQDPGGSGEGQACAVVCGVSCCSPALDALPASITVILLEARSFVAVLAINPPAAAVPKGPQIARAPPA